MVFEVSLESIRSVLESKRNKELTMNDFERNVSRGNYKRENKVIEIADLLIAENKAKTGLDVVWNDTNNTLQTTVKLRVRSLLQSSRKKSWVGVTDSGLAKKRICSGESVDENEMDVSSKCNETNFIQDLTIFSERFTYVC